MNEDFKKANELKQHLIDVISNLYSTYNLNDIMPLLNLLKIFIKKMEENDLVGDEKNKKFMGSADMNVPKKISYLVNRIHVESAMQASIERAIESFIKTGGIRDSINKLRYERSSSLEMKKLFVVALKQVLFENKIEETGLTNTILNCDNLEFDTMNFIKTQCTLCSVTSGTQKYNAIDQYCLCKMNISLRQTLKPVSGLLEISVMGFMGHYDSLDIDNIFKGIALPCADRALLKGKCKCSGLSNPHFPKKSKHDRMVVILVDKQLICVSKWCNTKVKGLMKQEIHLFRAKEIEIQVWENRKQKGLKGKQQFLIAAVSIPLESLINCTNKNQLIYNTDPAGAIICEVSLVSKKGITNKEDTPHITEHKIKRSFSIRRNIKHYYHERQMKQKECVNTWAMVFTDMMGKLIVTTENNNVATVPGHKSTFGNNSDKCTITKNKSQVTEQKLVSQERYINMAPSIYSTKLNQINPRTICPFFSTNESFYLCQNKMVEPKYSLSILHETLQTSKIDDTESVKIKAKTVSSTPISSRISNFITSTPISGNINSSLKQNTTNANHVSYRLMKGQKTRSNLELTDVNDIEYLVMNMPHSDDEDAKNELQYDGRFEEELNIIKIPKIKSIINESDLLPWSCTEDLRNIATFKIGNESKINMEWSMLDSPRSTTNGCRVSEKKEMSALDSPMSTTNGCRVSEKKEMSALDSPMSIRSSNLSIEKNEISSMDSPMPIRTGCRSIEKNEMSVSLCVSRPTSGANDSMVDENYHMEDFENVTYPDDCVDEQYYEMYDSKQGDSTYNSVHEQYYQMKRNGAHEDVVQRKLCLKDLELIRVLGQGHFGKVLLARYKQEPSIDGMCAIKVILKSQSSTELEYESLQSERDILQRITASDCSFLVGLIGCFQTERHLIFGLEYACGGDLMGHIHRGSFSEETACFYGACVVLALEFLHSEDIIYRDMKLDNILLDQHGYAKLADFGLSKQHMKWDSTTRTFCGTPEFLAPEIIREEFYNRCIDWWAFGVLLYEMILGETPFPGESDFDIYQEVLNSKCPNNASLSTEALSIVQRLLRQSPQNRLGYGRHGTSEVKAHIFFKDVEWQSMMCRTVVAPLVPKLDNPVDTQYFEEDFTNQSVTIEHEETQDNLVIDDDLFVGFDTYINWDKFVNLN